MNLLERVMGALTDLDVRTERPLAVACSGGGDSVALAHITTELGFDVTLLHVDHGLRPDSVDDASFVRDLAVGLGAACHVLCVDVPMQASREAAARDVRYAALEQRASELGIDSVLTAHTMDDQAETVLLRATRGGSLAGIAPRRGVFVRPLLDVTRDELRHWLVANDFAWRDDPTNDDLSIERNWTRNVLLPQLSSRREGVSRVLARLADRTREDDAVLDALAVQAYAAADVDEHGILVRGASDLPAAILRRVVRLAFRHLGAGSSEADIDAVLGGDRLRTKGLAAWFDGDLAVVRDPVVAPEPLRVTRGVVDAPQWGVRLRLGSPSDDEWAWRCVVRADDVQIRSRRAGDRVKTTGGTKKVHDVLIDAKIPRALRELVPVACSGDGALAVVGLTRTPGDGPFVLDAQPLGDAWTSRTVWS